jgi:hypothetical protein
MSGNELGEFVGRSEGFTEGLLDGIKVIVGGIVMRVGLMEMLGRRLG